MSFQSEYAFIGPLTGVPPADELPNYLGRLYINPLKPLEGYRPKSGVNPPFTPTEAPQIGRAENFEWLSKEAEKKELSGTLSSLTSACLSSVTEQGREINAQAMRIYTLQQEEDYLEHFMNEDKEAKQWVLDHLNGHSPSGRTRVFLAVGMITVMEAELEVLQAIKAERSLKVSFSDLLADISGQELLRKMKIDVKAKWTEDEMTQMKARYVEEHLIGIQYIELGTRVFHPSAVRIIDHNPNIDTGERLTRPGILIGEKPGKHGITAGEEPGEHGTLVEEKPWKGGYNMPGEGSGLSDVETHKKQSSRGLQEFKETEGKSEILIYTKAGVSGSDLQKFEEPDMGKWFSLAIPAAEAQKEEGKRDIL